MKHIRTYGQYRSSAAVNEELLGGLINFFKNMWGKAMEELKKLGSNPSVNALKKWIKENPFNPGDNNYMFKAVIDNFNKLPDAGINEQACLNLVQDIIDPEKGVIGKQGLQPLYDSLKKEYKDNLAPLTIVEFIMMTIRNGAIKQYKYAGGPDGGKVDPKKIILDIKDMTHLPDFKKLLAGKQPVAMKKVAADWCQKTLIPGLVKALDAITEDAVTKYLEGKDIEVPGDSKGGAGILVLGWGDVEIEIELPKEGGTTRYKIIKSSSERLVVSEGKEIFFDISGEVKKGDKIKLEKLSIAGAGSLKVDGNDFYETGEIDKINLDGKDVDSYKFEGGGGGEYKAGDSVIYKRDKWEDNKGQEAWDKMSDEEKKKPNEGKLKELIDNESVGIKTIKTVEKDFVRFTDVDWIKNNDEILGKVEAKVEGQEDLVKKLGELKGKKPEDIKKVASFVDFISDEKNKDKVAEIEKMIGGGQAQGE